MANYKKKAKSKLKAKSEGEETIRRKKADSRQIASDSEKEPKSVKRKKSEKKVERKEEKKPKNKSKLREKRRKSQGALKKKKNKDEYDRVSEEEETKQPIKEIPEPEEIKSVREKGRLPKYVAEVVVEKMFDRAWAICSERFYHRNGPYLIARELRNAFLRIIDMNFMDELYEKGTGGGKRLFNEDDPPLPLSLDTWSRGALELFPKSKRESIMDPFLRSDLYTPISRRISREAEEEKEESPPIPCSPMDYSKREKRKFFPPAVPSNSFVSFPGEGQGDDREETDEPKLVDEESLTFIKRPQSFESVNEAEKMFEELVEKKWNKDHLEEFGVFRKTCQTSSQAITQYFRTNPERLLNQPEDVEFRLPTTQTATLDNDNLILDEDFDSNRGDLSKMILAKIDSKGKGGSDGINELMIIKSNCPNKHHHRKHPKSAEKDPEGEFEDFDDDINIDRAKRGELRYSKFSRRGSEIRSSFDSNVSDPQPDSRKGSAEQKKEEMKEKDFASQNAEESKSSKMAEKDSKIEEKDQSFRMAEKDFNDEMRENDQTLTESNAYYK